MSVINFKFNNSAIKELMTIAQKQIPFALALALTRTAQEAQENIRNHIQEEFVIRKKSGGFTSSIRIKSATKRSLEAQVYSMASFAALQQTGGEKKAYKGGLLAIPAYDDIRKVKRRTSRNSPAGCLANGGFMMRLRSGQHAIASRARGAGRDFKILYFLNKKAHIPKRFRMVETTEQTTSRDFAILFNRSLRDAISKG